jgi:hypothetical protein
VVVDLDLVVVVEEQVEQVGLVVVEVAAALTQETPEQVYPSPN